MSLLRLNSVVWKFSEYPLNFGFETSILQKTDENVSNLIVCARLKKIRWVECFDSKYFGWGKFGTCSHQLYSHMQKHWQDFSHQCAALTSPGDGWVVMHFAMQKKNVWNAFASCVLSGIRMKRAIIIGIIPNVPSLVQRVHCIPAHCDKIRGNNWE